MLHVTSDASFAADTAQGVALVDFYADWCGPCKVMLPRLEELQSKLGASAKVMKINVDNDPETASSFGIMSIPTMIVFKDGKQVEKFVGAQDVSFLEAALRKYAA